MEACLERLRPDRNEALLVAQEPQVAQEGISFSKKLDAGIEQGLARVRAAVDREQQIFSRMPVLRVRLG